MGVPALNTLGLDKVNHISVSGLPQTAEALAFLNNLGAKASWVATDPVVAGPITVAGVSVVDTVIDEQGILHVTGDQVTGEAEGSSRTKLIAESTPEGIRVLGNTGTLLDTGSGTHPAAALEARLLASPLVRSATAVSSGAKIVVRIELSRGPASRWAQTHRLTATTYASFAALPELREAMEKVTREAAAAIGVDDVELDLLQTPLESVPGSLTSNGVPRRNFLPHIND